MSNPPLSPPSPFSSPLLPVTPSTPFITTHTSSSSGASSAYSKPIIYTCSLYRRSPRTHALEEYDSPTSIDEEWSLPPPLVLPNASLPFRLPEDEDVSRITRENETVVEHVQADVVDREQLEANAAVALEVEKGDGYKWRPGMTELERDKREEWLAAKPGRSGLRIVIVTENFLPKVDGVTRTLSRLLQHLHNEGHEAILLGPEGGMSEYEGCGILGTFGVGLVVYPGLKLNFVRPKFMRTIKSFEPDVIHFVDPIWLGAQVLMALELGWAGEEWVGESGPVLGGGITGAVVASYHTPGHFAVRWFRGSSYVVLIIRNLATYAKLFGWGWLEPILWRFQRWLYSKTLLTLCPSPSTLAHLEDNAIPSPRIWPRGVDLSQFSPSNRDMAVRATWGVGPAPEEQVQGSEGSEGLERRVVILYVGRISWEKNLHLLLPALIHLPALLPAGMAPPKMVFTGDGPALCELQALCKAKGIDAVFLGHKSGEELGKVYASADIFGFPSFTETFGQVVLEALASGLPVVGLDAPGTRDLVSANSTGTLLPLPASAPSWADLCRDTSSPAFQSLAIGYAELLAALVVDTRSRKAMGLRASEGVGGWRWKDAMEKCVDGYRESMRIARAKRHIQVIIPPHSPSPSPSDSASSPTAAIPVKRISRVRRVLSRGLASKDSRRSQDHLRLEGIWHLKTALKLILAAWAFWAIYTRHIAYRERMHLQPSSLSHV